MIPHNKPTIDEEEKKAASRVLESRWLVQGLEVENFENEFCDYLGIPPKHAVAVSSGTAGLYMALWALKTKGREVKIPCYSCSSLKNATRLINALEILVDSTQLNPNMDTSQLKENDVVIFPHYYGLPTNLKKLKCEIIEDACQALGAEVLGEKVGLEGKLGVYSFYATKLMTSGGQGGMVVSKYAPLIEAIRDYREFDNRADDKARFNFQMTDLQAAIGRVQLKKLPQFLERREEIYNRYREKGLELLDVADPTGIKPVRYRALVKKNNPQTKIESLENAGIKTINPLEDWELLGNPKNYQHAHFWTQNLLSLPIYPSLTNEEVDKIAEEVLR